MDSQAAGPIGEHFFPHLPYCPNSRVAKIACYVSGGFLKLDPSPSSLIWVHNSLLSLNMSIFQGSFN